MYLAYVYWETCLRTISPERSSPPAPIVKILMPFALASWAALAYVYDSSG